METIKPVKEVPFKLAGAKMKATMGMIEGTFHPIPLDLWNAIVGFHRQVSIDHGGESVTYHRWHETSGCYHTLIPWQQTSEHGLSVNVDWQDPRNMALLDAYAKQFKEEFLPACTIHTHVDTWAFESDTDAKDEHEAPGWHITLGHLLSYDKYDAHYRLRVPKLKSLKEIINVNAAIKIGWSNLFSPGPEVEAWIMTTPGTTDFHDKLERIYAG